MTSTAAAVTTTLPLDDTNSTISKEERKRRKKEKKKHRKHKKKSKKRERELDTAADDSSSKKHKRSKKATASDSINATSDSVHQHDEQQQQDRKPPPVTFPVPGDKLIVQTSALDVNAQQHQTSDSTTTQQQQEYNVTLLLFYQYVEPPWDSETYHQVLQKMQSLGDSLHLTGRMRVAKEGLNCTLTSSQEGILGFCKALREFPNGEFLETEFKLTSHLPENQRFPSLKVMPVTELVHYGLDGNKAPPIEYTGTHLQPRDYHAKLAQSDTVVIDVRNHYEANIGKFSAPNSTWLDPKMRKSTEFPVWLDKEETKQQLKGKQVLMYCTGGVRCERASALLKYKMETDPSVKDLGIQGVYQLQGGIDKYFKEYPDGGYWEGKNYTFDKRFAHAPVQNASSEIKLGKCEACHKPWDKYRGKRRCPTCGVPSLICRDCFQADKDGTKKLDRNVRCDLCVEENITSKAQVRRRDEEELRQYESKMAQQQKGSEELDSKPAAKSFASVPNPNGVTRLLLKNMCRKRMDEATLMYAIPGITHIVWRTDRKTGQFFGSAWVEMATPEAAAVAVGMNGKRVLGRPLYVEFCSPDGKDAWPPASSKVV